MLFLRQQQQRRWPQPVSTGWWTRTSRRQLKQGNWRQGRHKPQQQLTGRTNSKNQQQEGTQHHLHQNILAALTHSNGCSIRAAAAVLVSTMLLSATQSLLIRTWLQVQTQQRMMPQPLTAHLQTQVQMQGRSLTNTAAAVGMGQRRKGLQALLPPLMTAAA